MGRTSAGRRGLLTSNRKRAQLSRGGLNNFQFGVAPIIACFRTSIWTNSYGIHFAARSRISEYINAPSIFMRIGAFNLFGPKFGDRRLWGSLGLLGQVNPFERSNP